MIDTNKSVGFSGAGEQPLKNIFGSGIGFGTNNKDKK